MSDVVGYRRPYFNTQPDRLYPPAANSAFHQAEEVFAQMQPGAG